MRSSPGPPFDNKDAEFDNRGVKAIYDAHDKFLKDRSDTKKAAGEKYHYAPHCDGRVLHHPQTCQYCAMPEFDDVRQFRLDNKILYTGEAPRSGWWACPAEHERSLKKINMWPGNSAKPEGCICGYWYDPENPCPIDHSKQ